jgi:putative flippase GtrA
MGWSLGDGKAVQYSISVLIAYAAGIVLSFLLNRALTFKTDTSHGWSRFPAFVLIAGIGLILTWLLSLLLRYELEHEGLFGRFSGTVAFAGAALVSSATTYPLNLLLVFQRSRNR